MDAYDSHVCTYFCSSLRPAKAFANEIAASFVGDVVMELKKYLICKDSATEDDKQGESQTGLPFVLAMEPPRSNGSKEQVDPLSSSDSSNGSEAVALLIPKMRWQPTKDARAS